MGHSLTGFHMHFFFTAMATSIGAGQESEQGNRRVIGYPLRNWVVLEAGCYLALGARLRVARVYVLETEVYAKSFY